MQYKVREQFYVYLDGKVSEPGTVLDLDDAQYELVAHQVEPVEAPKPARKVKADAPIIESKEVTTNGTR